MNCLFKVVKIHRFAGDGEDHPAFTRLQGDGHSCSQVPPDCMSNLGAECELFSNSGASMRLTVYEGRESHSNMLRGLEEYSTYSDIPVEFHALVAEGLYVRIVESEAK